MKKPEFIKKIAETTGMSQKDTAVFLDGLNAVVLEAIANEDACPFAFGKVGGRLKNGGEKRNPRTGDKVIVPDKHGYPYCKFNKAAKE